MRALRASSGGILDPDDKVRDVADDRETLTAECTNQSHPRAAQADGASGSSAGTASPDMFRVSDFIDDIGRVYCAHLKNKLHMIFKLHLISLN